MLDEVGEVRDPSVSVTLSRARTAIDELARLIDRIDPDHLDRVEFLDLLAAAGMSLHRFDNSMQTIGAALNLKSAKDRMRAYFVAHVGEVVNTYQINGVSGIQESPRRIRELRAEEGMQISAGPAGDLGIGEYRLEAVDSDPEEVAS